MIENRQAARLVSTVGNVSDAYVVQKVRLVVKSNLLATFFLGSNSDISLINVRLSAAGSVKSEPEVRPSSPSCLVPIDVVDEPEYEPDLGSKISFSDWNDLESSIKLARINIEE
ncbi:hypothetical protein BLOT_006469 [Blomia tropicalis]|nr:hypothetical protein BLOT_006469 [Blomia tropicalis]